MARPRSDIRARVLSAARKQFLREGVDGASLRRIAKSARTSIGMVYYYFPSKDDLFHAVVGETYDAILADFAEALKPDAPFEQRVKRFYVRIGKLTEREFEVMRLVVREALVSAPRLERLVERFKQGHLALIATAVGDGIAAGKVDPSHHPALLVLFTLIAGAMPQLLLRVAGDNFPFPDVPRGEALAEQLVRLLVSGVGKHPPSTSGDADEN